jgi:hypothetical protein
MGLTIHYRLTMPGDTSADDLRAKILELKAFAETVGFEGVHGPTEYTPDELAELEDRDIVKIVTSIIASDAPEFDQLEWGDPCALAFLIVPGAECETALLGFLAPGTRSSAEDHPGEWYWSAFCKTQYASMVSDEHFIKCHVGLVRVLDYAAQIGIGVWVHDETGYWDHRSTEKLIDAVNDMNRLMARFAGALSDRLGGKRVEAAIFDHPDFEHIEMESLSARHQADGADSDPDD